jgi:hypothetical protein
VLVLSEAEVQADVAEHARRAEAAEQLGDGRLPLASTWMDLRSPRDVATLEQNRNTGVAAKSVDKQLVFPDRVGPGG